MAKVMPMALGAAALALAGCTTVQDTVADIEGSCDADKGQSFVGQRATAEVGAELLRLTGAQQLRWGPPNSAMTMDFRTDRLTVAYDNGMIIERITCG